MIQYLSSDEKIPDECPLCSGKIEQQCTPIAAKNDIWLCIECGNTYFREI